MRREMRRQEANIAVKRRKGLRGLEFADKEMVTQLLRPESKKRRKLRQVDERYKLPPRRIRKKAFQPLTEREAGIAHSVLAADADFQGGLGGLRDLPLVR